MEKGSETIHVGIIEDEADYPEMLAQMLDGTDGIACNQTFDCFESAQPYFEKTKKPPEVMLVDINLPGANGIEAIKALKALQTPSRSICFAVYGLVLPITSCSLLSPWWPKWRPI